MDSGRSQSAKSAALKESDIGKFISTVRVAVAFVVGVPWLIAGEIYACILCAIRPLRLRSRPAGYRDAVYSVMIYRAGKFVVVARDLSWHKAGELRDRLSGSTVVIELVYEKDARPQTPHKSPLYVVSLSADREAHRQHIMKDHAG